MGAGGSGSGVQLRVFVNLKLAVINGHCNGGDGCVFKAPRGWLVYVTGTFYASAWSASEHMGLTRL